MPGAKSPWFFPNAVYSTPSPAFDTEARMAERGENYRPYRRFMIVLFTVLVFGICGVIIRGITRTLDRLPQAEHMLSSRPLDGRALRACAEDLRKLETKIRISASQQLGRAPADEVRWEKVAAQLELERVTLVGRCGLHEGSDDPARAALASAAEALEELLRVYGFLEHRFDEAARPASARALEALGEAETRLR